MTQSIRRLCWLLVAFLPCAHAVVGGQTEKDLDWPFLGSIRSLTSSAVLPQHDCGGTYLGNGYFLTAAHCANRQPDWTRVCLGHSGAAVRNNCYPVSEIIRHPDYSSSHSYQLDVALFRLEGVSDNYPHALLPTTAQDAQFNPNTQLRILGLGVTDYSDINYSNPAFQLQGVAMPLIDIDTCQQRIGGAMPVDDRHFLCAGSSSHGPAMGDSGTGAFVWLANQPVLAGLVSHGYNYTGVFTRIEPYTAWIRDHMQDALGELVVPERLSWAQDSEGQLTGVLRLTNLTEQALDLENVWLADEEQFQVTATTCDQIAAGGSCQLELQADMQGQTQAQSLIQLQYSGVTYQTELQVFALSTEQGKLVAGDDQWQHGDDGELATSADGLAKQMYLYQANEQAGYLVLSGKLQGFSGEDSLQLMAGSQLLTQFSGRCEFESFALPIEAGKPLLVKYLAGHQGLEPEAGYLRLDRLSFHPAGQELPAPRLRCDYVDASTQSDSAREDSTGGGGGSSGLGLIALLLLMRAYRVKLVRLAS